MTIEQLLEQHDHYELGDGWSMGRSDLDSWHIYYRAKHINIWDAKQRGVKWDGEWHGHDSAYAAWLAWMSLKPLCDWAKPTTDQGQPTKD